MQVILQERVANLGDVGDMVNVRPGYGRNFLLPFSKAVLATPENIKIFEARRAELEKIAAETLLAAQQRAEKLGALSVTLEAQASEEGNLYGSVGPRDIAVAVTEAGVEVEKSEVNLPEGPIRHVGEYKIDLQLHSEVKATITLFVKAA